MIPINLPMYTFMRRESPADSSGWGVEVTHEGACTQRTHRPEYDSSVLYILVFRPDTSRSCRYAHCKTCFLLAIDQLRKDINNEYEVAFRTNILRVMVTEERSWTGLDPATAIPRMKGTAP